MADAFIMLTLRRLARGQSIYSPPMRILLADAFEQSGLDALAEGGFEIDYRPQLQSADLAAAVGEADVLVVRSTRVEADVFAEPGPLGLVIRAGAGTNTIDTDAAAARAVFVANVPGKNAVAVAELTMGLLLALDRRIADNVADARAGPGTRRPIRRRTACWARPSGSSVLARSASRWPNGRRLLDIRVVVIARRNATLTKERMKAAGIDTVPGPGHSPQRLRHRQHPRPRFDQTKNLVDAEFLAQLAPGTILINTSRGDVLDEDALLAAIDDKGLRVGIDVFADEPASGTGEFDSALARHPARLHHPSHRRLNRPGAGSNRRRSRGDDP